MARFTSMLLSGMAQCVGRGLGLFTVCVACLLISDVIFVYSHYTLPLLATHGSLSYYALLLTMSLISFGVLFNYYMAVGVCPGYVFNWTPPETELEAVDSTTEDLTDDNNHNAGVATVTINESGDAVVGNSNQVGGGGVRRRGGTTTGTSGGGGGSSLRPTTQTGEDLPPGCLPPVIALKKKQPVLAPGQYGGPGNETTYCRRCDTHRPARAHHCMLCGRCVLKMDHHCPWVNSCVGYHNQRYFYLFLFWLLIGTFYTGCGYTCIYYDSCVGVWSEKFHHYVLDGRVLALRESTVLMFSLVLVIALFFAMCGFVGWNTYMILTNQTSIESQSNSASAAAFSRSGLGMFRNPYDLGRLRNLKEVFAATRGPPLAAHAGGVNPSKWPMFVVKATRVVSQALDAFEKGNQIIGAIGLTLASVQHMPSDGYSYPTFYTEGGGGAHQVQSPTDPHGVI